jgi:hypothetical protein
MKWHSWRALFLRLWPKGHCPAGPVSICRPTIVLFCPGASQPWFFIVTCVQCQQSKLQCFTCSESFCQKLAEAA